MIALSPFIFNMYTHQYQYIFSHHQQYLYFQPSLTRDQLVSRIEKVQTELDEAKIKSEWRSIMEDVHAQSLFMPLYGTRIPYVLNRRLSGFTPSAQAYSIPVNTIQVVSGSRDLTLNAPHAAAMPEDLQFSFFPIRARNTLGTPEKIWIC